MNNGKYDFVCIDSESEECRRDIEAHNESKKWGETLECGGANHPNRRRIPMPTLSPFVSDNGYPLDHETDHAVFKAFEYRRAHRRFELMDTCFTAAIAAILWLGLFAICVNIYAKSTNDYIRLHGADEYFPEKTISDCKLKRILYFSGKSREYVCPDGSLVVVGKDVRNKKGE